MLNVSSSLQLNMSLILLAVFGLFTIIAIGSLQVADLELRHLIIGFLSCATLISMFASPLSVMVNFFCVELYIFV